MKNLASKGPPMNNLVCNEKFGINYASAEAQFGTGRGIMPYIDHSVHTFKAVLIAVYIFPKNSRPSMVLLGTCLSFWSFKVNVSF